MQTRRLKIPLLGILTRTLDILQFCLHLFGLDITVVFKISSVGVYHHSTKLKQSTAVGVLTLPLMVFNISELNIVTARSKKRWLVEFELSIRNQCAAVWVGRLAKSSEGGVLKSCFYCRISIWITLYSFPLIA